MSRPLQREEQRSRHFSLPLIPDVRRQVGLLAWFREQRQWHRDHVAAFSVVTQQQSDGLTEFQHMALSAVSAIVPPNQFRRVTMDKDLGHYLVAELGGGGAELSIYPNEAMIFGQKPNSWFEEWDYRTPEELIEALVRECAARLNRPARGGSQ